MPRRPHLLRELGFAVRPDGEALHGTASITPYMHVPGTECLRASILASWADMLCGLLSMRAFAGRVSVTLELDVHLYRPAPGSGTVTATGRVVKAGRSVFVGEVEFADARGEAFGFSAASFMAAPGESLRPPRPTRLEIPPPETLLSMPLAERADCKRQAPGVAVLHKSEDGLNSGQDPARRADRAGGGGGRALARAGDDAVVARAALPAAGAGRAGGGDGCRPGRARAGLAA